VEWVGSQVTDVSVGDHVVLSFAHCGACAQCTSGHPAYCQHFSHLNVLGGTGDGAGAVDSTGAPLSARWFGQSSFATRVVVNAASAVVVDKDVPFELIAPLGCGMVTGAGSVLNCLEVSDGESFVVFGAGSVGLAALIAAKDVGTDPVIAVDLHQSRLDSGPHRIGPQRVSFSGGVGRH
jgi:aryl-alcohol dehydrogenase